MVVRSEASWKVSRSPLAIRTVPPRLSSAAAAAARKSSASKPGALAFWKPQAADEFRDEVELLKQGVVELSTALVGREFLMPVGGHFQRVPGYQHRARLFLAVKTQQKIGKAEDGAGGLAASPQDRLWQSMIGAMGERIAVDDQQGAACDRCGAPHASFSLRRRWLWWFARWDLFRTARGSLSTIHAGA